MKINLFNRNFLTLADFDASEILYLLDLAMKLKNASFKNEKKLIGKKIALIFEKDSTRTRCAFEVAAYNQGAHVTYIGPSGSQISKKESIKDTARVLGRYYDGIQYRGYSQQVVEILATYSGVPVWNGLTNEDHPTQALADLLTIRQHSDKSFNQIKLCYIGNGQNNTATALMLGATKMGINFWLASPKIYWPKDIKKFQNIAKENNGNFTITTDIVSAVKDTDFIYTDVWVSLGESDTVWDERIEFLRPYQINSHVMQLANNSHVKFMHCLPSIHNQETEFGKTINEKYGLSCMEVTDDVFESKNSIVFDQAENRLHTIEAIMIATLAS
jgi:ornithine carbamoyltransferase